MQHNPDGNDTPPPAMLRPSQVVKRYSLPRDRIYAAIHARELPAYDVGSPRRPAFLIRATDVEAWLESLRFGGKK